MGGLRGEQLKCFACMHGLWAWMQQQALYMTKFCKMVFLPKKWVPKTLKSVFGGSKISMFFCILFAIIIHGIKHNNAKSHHLHIYYTACSCILRWLFPLKTLNFIFSAKVLLVAANQQWQRSQREVDVTFMCFNSKNFKIN